MDWGTGKGSNYADNSTGDHALIAFCLQSNGSGVSMKSIHSVIHTGLKHQFIKVGIIKPAKITSFRFWEHTGLLH